MHLTACEYYHLRLMRVEKHVGGYVKARAADKQLSSMQNIHSQNHASFPHKFTSINVSNTVVLRVVKQILYYFI